MDITFTYTYAKGSDDPAKEAAKVTKARTANKLTYNGKDRKLVAKGTASNGKMYYAVTKSTTAPKASNYAKSIPTGKAAGTYYVWYKAKSYKLEDTKKKELSNAHGAKFRYRSTNSKIAKVDKEGKITGVKEGNCKVFVYTRNGLSRKIEVTVTK